MHLHRLLLHPAGRSLRLLVSLVLRSAENGCSADHALEPFKSQTFHVGSDVVRLPSPINDLDFLIKIGAGRARLHSD